MNQFMLGHCECPTGSEWEASERYVLEDWTQRGTEMASLAKVQERSMQQLQLHRLLGAQTYVQTNNRVKTNKQTKKRKKKTPKITQTHTL